MYIVFIIHSRGSVHIIVYSLALPVSDYPRIVHYSHIKRSVIRKKLKYIILESHIVHPINKIILIQAATSRPGGDVSSCALAGPVPHPLDIPSTGLATSLQLDLF